MRYIIDSSAWIDYLEGEELGEEVRKIILSNNEIYVSNLIIAEVISYIQRKKGNTQLAYSSITSNSEIAELTPEIAKEAGLLHAEMKVKSKNFGLVDAFILVLAKKLNAKILTADEHFRNFKEAIFVR